MNHSEKPRPTFPISVKFEDGIVETFDDVTALETDLEVFDSDLCPACEVKDSEGRRVRLRINHRLELENLSLIEQDS